MIGGFIKWILAAVLGQKIAIAFYGGLAACVVIAAFGFYQWGHNVAGNACEAAALRAERDALKVDLAAANDRAARAALVIATLNERRYTTEGEIRALRDDLATAQLQSTQPGAKHDPTALLDDKCNYTERGLQRRRLHR